MTPPTKTTLDELRAVAKDMLAHIDAYEDAMGHSYCDMQSGDYMDSCTCGFQEKHDRWVAAIAQPAPPAEALRVAMERVEHDGLIVILGAGDPEERTDFTMAPTEAAAALRRYLASATEGEGTP